MKKKLTVLVLAFAMVFTMMALTACGGGSSDSGEESAAEETFTFKHGYDKDFPPYSYIGDDGETTGFDVELAQAVCELNGWNYEGVAINWDAKDAELESGSIDCIWSGFTGSGRFRHQVDGRPCRKEGRSTGKHFRSGNARDSER